ncbi:dethiobiotin synthase [Caulobacter sp. NIBR2454]|uniref:dethiobiotin synthase n=1 Tax=Caulobacter sp. NIBR2454 TaxID=3015996 RepID=UPI0022B64BE9|nr:dethiobiotin synthase [Caulobacter sp. NIBR2454]
MSAMFITATGTDVGKTYVACALIRALRAEGRAVRAFKPVVSGFDPADTDASDPGRLRAALGDGAPSLEDISPLRFAAPLSPPLAARLEGVHLELDRLEALCRTQIAGDGPLLIEGAGGVMSPLTDEATNLDLIARLTLPVILVCGSYLGTISHTLTALEVLKARGVTVAAIVMSESEGAPDLGETAASLAAFVGEIATLTAPRHADGWDASDLARRLQL